MIEWAIWFSTEVCDCLEWFADFWKKQTEPLIKAKDQVEKGKQMQLTAEDVENFSQVSIN